MFYLFIFTKKYRKRNETKDCLSIAFYQGCHERTYQHAEVVGKGEQLPAAPDHVHGAGQLAGLGARMEGGKKVSR